MSSSSESLNNGSEQERDSEQHNGEYWDKTDLQKCLEHVARDFKEMPDGPEKEAAIKRNQAECYRRFGD